MQTKILIKQQNTAWRLSFKSVHLFFNPENYAQYQAHKGLYVLIFIIFKVP